MLDVVVVALLGSVSRKEGVSSVRASHWEKEILRDLHGLLGALFERGDLGNSAQLRCCLFYRRHTLQLIGKKELIVPRHNLQMTSPCRGSLS